MSRLASRDVRRPVVTGYREKVQHSYVSQQLGDLAVPGCQMDTCRAPLPG